jgi:pyruvate/2-oxoglutarate dehydrogenase complex dihydrolipoamide acyltransferase (E2) component
MPMMRRGPGLVGTAARVGVGVGVAGRVQHRQQQKFAAQDQEQYEQQQDEQQAAAPPPAAAPAAAPDYTVELEKLAKLRDDGVITAEDFEAKKQQLLGI